MLCINYENNQKLPFGKIQFYEKYFNETEDCNEEIFITTNKDGYYCLCYSWEKDKKNYSTEINNVCEDMNCKYFFEEFKAKDLNEFISLLKYNVKSIRLNDEEFYNKETYNEYQN